ncbi:MAG: S8 family serine peptidase [Hyphomonadaceae bacterium]
MRALWVALAIGAAALVANVPGRALAVPGGGGEDDFGPADIDEPDAPDLEAPDEIDPPDLPDEALDAPDSVDEPDIPDVEEPDAVDAPDVDQAEVEEAGDIEDGAPDAEPDEVEEDDGGSDDFDEQSDDDSDENLSGSGHGGDDESEGENSSHGGGDANGGGSGSSGSGGGDDDADIVERHRSGPIEIESDEHGQEYLAREVLLAGSAEDVSAAQREGYRLISDDTLGGDDRRLARLFAPDHLETAVAVASLQALIPDSIVTPNTAYRSTQAGRPRNASTALSSREPPRNIVIGVIDTGVDATLTNEGVVATRAFGQGGYSVREHGTSVAAILADQRVRMRVADVFGGTSRGDPVASASAIAGALQWMIDARVPVINISIEGPSNEILRRMIADAAREGFVIVAAAGNGGPLADPAFPAAYDGVVAVTAVDGSERPYLRANRGEYVDFAAFGVGVPVQLGDSTLTVSGTSFAAPIVAVRIAERLPAPSPEAASLAIDAVRNAAVDRGAPGHDPIYGWGVVRAHQ